MLYHDHGLGTAFTDYSKYFSLNTDVESVTYLQLATDLIKSVNPNAICISEDMSAMPGMCLPIEKVVLALIIGLQWVYLIYG